MFVVRRSFRNNGEMVLPGSIVEPGSIKWFKTRLKDRDIIEVTPHTFNAWNSYFKQKFGTEIPDMLSKPIVENIKETTQVQPEPKAKPAIKPTRVIATIKK